MKKLSGIVTFIVYTMAVIMDTYTNTTGAGGKNNIYCLCNDILRQTWSNFVYIYIYIDTSLYMFVSSTPANE